MKKRPGARAGIVYSTNPDFKLTNGEDDDTEDSRLPVSQQRIDVSLDKKNRAGKIVTLITGFDHPDEKLDLIGREIKKYCGTGGSAKNGEVIIQGDFRDKAVQWLRKNGYALVKKR